MGMKIRLTPAAKDAWELFAAEHGVTVTSLIETAGRLLTDPAFREHWKNDERFAHMIETARHLDNERRKRS